MSDPEPTTNPGEQRSTHSQDAARRIAPPAPGREQIMNGLIWSAMCLTEDAAHKLYDCVDRRLRERANPTMQSAIADLRRALSYLTGEAV